MTRFGHLARQAVGVVLAASIVLVVAYVLSWQLLWGGMAGSEAPFHLHLIQWVATTFPNLPWWYPWDGMGVSYREAYPLASHWLSVAASQLFSTSLEGGAQVVQFALMPASALGVCAFFAWRLKRPMAGVVAAVLFLISPLPWVEWTRFGLFASWAGMPLFMPAVISLDVFFVAWLAGVNGWRMRAGAGGYIAFTTLMGTVSPHLLAAPLLMAAAYALAVPSSARARVWRWLLLVVPGLWIGVVLLSMFWLGGELQYLSVVRSHWAGAGTNFDIDRLTPIDLSNLLSIHSLNSGDLGSLYSISPAVLLPAIAGAIVGWRYGFVRMFFVLTCVSVALMAFRDLYRPFFAIPGFAEFGVLAHRPFLLLASFGAPIVAAVGLCDLPVRVIGLLPRVASRRLMVPASVFLIAVLVAGDLVGFAARVQGGGSQLAYGPGITSNGGDVWQRKSNASLANQLLDPRQWRRPQISCDLGCPNAHEHLAMLGATFPSPPQRAELNSNVAQLDMAFHTLVGGGITHSYNDQSIPSRELAGWLEQSMLMEPGTTTKSQLADALGVDAVVLSAAQAERASDYRQMSWSQVSSNPIAFVNPAPSGLAAQWESGTAVLVVGSTQASTPALYNFVFERATTGLLPFSTAWLVRGTTPYIDDYSDADLGRFAGVILLGYRYHDRDAAWSRLDRFVRGGGSLFVETGWQYVDPDWDLGAAPSTLPVPTLKWSVLDPSATVVVDGQVDAAFGRFTYGGGGWGASSATGLRPGATELVRVGDRVVAARWTVGRGRVLWSGMNLLAHEASSGSAEEDQFTAAQLAWLFAPAADAGTQDAIQPVWTDGDHATLSLHAASRPSLVLLKESLFPGWSARLFTPSGTQQVDLVGSEMDFILARIGPVPAGSTLVFTYGPTLFEQATWWLSLLFLAALATWLVQPSFWVRSRRRLDRLVSGLAARASSWGEED